MLVNLVNVFRITVGLLLLFFLGCGESSSPSTSPESVAWGTALSSWPTQGDPNRIAKTSIEQSSYNLWHDIRVSPMEDANNPMTIVSPEVIAIIETSKRVVDPLHELNGAWGAPNTGGAMISTRSIRGLGKSIWSDLRLAVRIGDRSRAVGDLILLANLPRVARELDASDRGLLPALAAGSILYWGMVDVSRGGEAMELTPEQCARISAAASWVLEPEPFGEISEKNALIWKGFQEREIPKLRKQLASICDE